MNTKDQVALLVEIPRELRQRVRIAAAQREETITAYVRSALESALAFGSRVANDAQR